MRTDRRFNLVEVFQYLDDLRESGETNMYGAGPYLRDEFDATRDESHALLQAWMDTFNRDKTPEQRAATVQS